MLPRQVRAPNEKIKLTVDAAAGRSFIPPRKSPAEVAQQIIANVQRVIVGKPEQVTLAVAALFAEGHILFEDVPGVAKTMLSRAVAQSAGCSFKRIQCTPDLQPEHVIGDFTMDPTTGKKDFRFGPLFSQMVLVDEINRASPRTQSALLEAMGEGMVTMDRVSYRLEKPFMVMATQNPDRTGRHVPAAGGADGPLSSAHQPRLSRRARRKRKCASARSSSIPSKRSSRSRRATKF